MEGLKEKLTDFTIENLKKLLCSETEPKLKESKDWEKILAAYTTKNYYSKYIYIYEKLLQICNKRTKVQNKKLLEEETWPWRCPAQISLQEKPEAVGRKANG